MFCRKCGNKKTTKRSAGIFHCKRCGMQPGQMRMDRAGNPDAFEKPPQSEAPADDYVFSMRQPRLRAGTAKEQ